MKKCTTCAETKPLDDFSKDHRREGRLRSRCKACASAATRDWQKRNPERKRANAQKWALKEYQSRTPEQNREIYLRRYGSGLTARGRYLKREFALTQEQVRDMWIAQDRKCALCLREIQEVGRASAVDHDHKTGAIRGFLCVHCNLGLGHFYDDVETLKKAVLYLSRNLHDMVTPG